MAALKEPRVVNLRSARTNSMCCHSCTAGSHAVGMSGLFFRCRGHSCVIVRDVEGAPPGFPPNDRKLGMLNYTSLGEKIKKDHWVSMVEAMRSDH